MRNHRSTNGQSQQSNRQQTSHRQHSRRGFASMDPEEHRRISSLGGQHSHNGDRGQNQTWDQDERYSMGTQGANDYQGSSRGSYADQNRSSQGYQGQQGYQGEQNHQGSQNFGSDGYGNSQRGDYQNSMNYGGRGGTSQSRFNGSSMDEPQQYNESAGYNDNYRLQDDGYSRQGQYGSWQGGAAGSMDRSMGRGQNSGGQGNYDQSSGYESSNDRGGYRDSNGYQGSINSYDSDRQQFQGGQNWDRQQSGRGYSGQSQNLDRSMNLNYNNNDQDYLDNYQSRNGRKRY